MMFTFSFYNWLYFSLYSSVVLIYIDKHARILHFWFKNNFLNWNHLVGQLQYVILFKRLQLDSSFYHQVIGFHNLVPCECVVGLLTDTRCIHVSKMPQDTLQMWICDMIKQIDFEIEKKIPFQISCNFIFRAIFIWKLNTKFLGKILRDSLCWITL